jgi:hypothetical protein
MAGFSVSARFDVASFAPLRTVSVCSNRPQLAKKPSQDTDHPAGESTS